MTAPATSAVVDRVPVTMRALVKDHAGPGLRLREVPTPAPGTGEVLVRVPRTGVCGTDLHIHRWDRWAVRKVRPVVVATRVTELYPERWDRVVDRTCAPVFYRRAFLSAGRRNPATSNAATT